MESNDVQVFEHENYGWIAVEENGTIHYFDSEGEACAFQRGYRVANGLDAITGEINKS